MDKIKKISKVLIVIFAIIGLLCTIYILMDYLGAQGRAQGLGVRLGPRIHFFAPNIDYIIDQGDSTVPPNLRQSYPTDFSQSANLVGGASNVFVAKVIAQTGNKETSVGPRTQYSVSIIRNIKGNLSGTVTLDELGGYRDEQLVLIEGISPDDFFLTPGATYVFATRYNDKEDWHTVIGHPNGMKLLTKDVSLGATALQRLIDQDLKVQTLEAAYPNEVLLGADIAHTNTRNAFQSLPPEAKAAAVARADAARAALGVGSEGQ